MKLWKLVQYFRSFISINRTLLKWKTRHHHLSQNHMRNSQHIQFPNTKPFNKHAHRMNQVITRDSVCRQIPLCKKAKDQYTSPLVQNPRNPQLQIMITNNTHTNPLVLETKAQITNPYKQIVGSLSYKQNYLCLPNTFLEVFPI
jgi:hypothetical protein